LPQWKTLSSRRKPIERRNDFEIQRTSVGLANLRAAEDEAALHSSALDERDCSVSDQLPQLSGLFSVNRTLATFSFSARDGKRFHGAASRLRESSFPKMIELSQCVLVA
jgi:hypothetical protein